MRQIFERLQHCSKAASEVGVICMEQKGILKINEIIPRMTGEDWMLLTIILLLLLDGQCDIILLVVMACIFLSNPELKLFG
jgi:hypothetical protein